MNWGKGIAIFYTCFVVIMVSMVVFAVRNQAELVQDNYYQLDIEYENYRLKKVNARLLPTTPTAKYNKLEKRIEIDFPLEHLRAEGLIKISRSSDKSLDRSYPMQLDEKSRMLIPMEKGLKTGPWNIQVDWQNDGVNYLTELFIVA